MLPSDQIDALREVAGQLMDPVVKFLIEEIAERVKTAGQLTSTASYQTWILQQMGVGQKKLKQELAKKLGMTREEIGKLMKQAAKVGYDFDLSRFPTSAAIPFEENTSIQQILTAAIALADDDFTNLTRTMGFVSHDGKVDNLTDAYRKACDFAFEKVVTGAQDYNSAVRQAVKGLADKGIFTIDYKSGTHRSIEVAVRDCVLGGLGLMDEKICQQNHDDLGCDGWEISAHRASAPDHEPIQGKQYTDAQYKSLNSSLRRRIGTLHCGHSAMGIIMGVNEPQYTPEELEELRRENEEGVTYDGQQMTLYQATQRQSSLERKIRKQEKNILLDEALGDEEQLQTDQIRYQVLSQEYRRFSKATGQKLRHERLEAAGFGPKQAKAAEKPYNAIAKQANSMYDVGNTEKNIRAFRRDQPIRQKIGSEEYPLNLHKGRQNKHIPGTHEYKQYVEKLSKKGEFGPSRLTIDEETIKALVEKYHGTGILLKKKDGSWRGVERITVHPDTVGVAVNNLTGAEADTMVFTIRYSKDGYHIVPDYPSRKGDKAKE